MKIEVVPCVGWLREAPWEMTGRYSISSIFSAVLLPGMWRVPHGPKTQYPHPGDLRVVSWGGRTLAPGSHRQCSPPALYYLLPNFQLQEMNFSLAPFGICFYLHPDWNILTGLNPLKVFVFDPKRPVNWVLWSLFLQTRKLRQSK